MSKRSELRIAQTCGLQDDLPKLLCGEIIQLHSTEHWPRQFEDRFGAGVPCMSRIRHAEDLGSTSFRGLLTATQRYGRISPRGSLPASSARPKQPSTPQVAAAPCPSPWPRNGAPFAAFARAGIDRADHAGRCPSPSSDPWPWLFAKHPSTSVLVLTTSQRSLPVAGCEMLTADSSPRELLDRCRQMVNVEPCT